MKYLAFFVLCVTLCGAQQQQQQQTDKCYSRTMHTCVGRNHFRECRPDANGNLVPTGAIHSCQVMTRSQGSVCYGRVRTKEEICGTPPPACVQEGSFSIKNHCASFYSCHVTGSGYGQMFTQFIGTCEPGFDFSPRLSKCTSSVRNTPCEDYNSPLFDDQLMTRQGTYNVTAPTICPANTKVADPSNCKRFFQCASKPGGQHVLTTCPFNFKFDETSSVCRREANCGIRPVDFTNSFLH